MEPAMRLCNFGQPASFRWKVGVAGATQTETMERAHQFVRELFGDDILAGINKNWTNCGYSNAMFFGPHASAAAETSSTELTSDLVLRLGNLYAEDMRLYAQGQRALDYQRHQRKEIGRLTPSLDNLAVEWARVNPTKSPTAIPKRKPSIASKYLRVSMLVVSGSTMLVIFPILLAFKKLLARSS